MGFEKWGVWPRQSAKPKQKRPSQMAGFHDWFGYLFFRSGVNVMSQEGGGVVTVTIMGAMDDPAKDVAINMISVSMTVAEAMILRDMLSAKIALANNELAVTQGYEE